MTTPAMDGEGHYGLFGPRSVTWRVHSDPLMGLATLSALLLRVLHPEGQASVFATQQSLTDPWARVARTLRYIGVITFGSSAEAIMAAARVRSIHSQVAGTRSDGTPFRGDDPDLLLWMHCCQVSSFLYITQRGGLQLTPAQADEYLHEQVRSAVAWGLEPGQVPVTTAALRAYLRRGRASLAMTTASRIFIGAVVEPALPEPMMFAQRNRPAWASVAGLAFAALPSWARRIYGTRPAVGPASFTQTATTVALHTVRDSMRERTASLSGPLPAELVSGPVRARAPVPRGDPCSRGEAGDDDEIEPPASPGEHGPPFSRADERAPTARAGAHPPDQGAL
jgi:uncharacterized protein (DUF2236 family)